MALGEAFSTTTEDFDAPTIGRGYDLLPAAERARLGRAIFAAQVLIFFERTKHILTPLLIGALAGLALAVWGAADALLGFWKLSLLLGIGLIALSLAIRGGILGLRWPSRTEALMRLETDSGLTHAPLRSLYDPCALGNEALWQAHALRNGALIARLRLGRSRALIAASDPLALRYLGILVAGLGIFLRGVDASDQSLQGLIFFTPLEGAPEQVARLAKSLLPLVNSLIG